MNHHFESVDLVALAQISGGQQKPQTQQPSQQQQQQRQQQQGGSDTQWVSNAARCARVGGPLLGALCGVMTPTPAY